MRLFGASSVAFSLLDQSPAPLEGTTTMRSLQLHGDLLQERGAEGASCSLSMEDKKKLNLLPELLALPSFPSQVSIVRQGARPPVSIATNEMSRRRSAAAVAFVPASAAAAASSGGKKGGAAAGALSARLLGDDAAAAAARRPEAAVLRLRDLLMLLASPPPPSNSSLGSLFPPSSPSWPLTLAVADEERIPGGGLALAVGSGASSSSSSSKKNKATPLELHSPEELAGAVLRYAQRVATAAAAEGLPTPKKDPKTGKKIGAPPAVVDCVVTIPPSLPPAARAALLDGAAAAGINVLSLVSTPAAVSLAYGIERRFEEASAAAGSSKKGGSGSGSASAATSSGPQLLVIYDQGSTHTSAALIQFSAYREPPRKGQSALSAAASAAPVSQFELLDLAWDSELGADALDEALLRHFAAEFEEQSGVDLLAASEGEEGTKKLSKQAAARALARLRKAVRRTKEVLSANADAPCSVEELLDGRDFRSSIDRKAFEKLAGSHFARSAAPLAAVLSGNGNSGTVKISDLAAVELVGGGTRVPGLQAALSKALGGRALDRHLDADEAAAHGAALFAANASTAFRLRRFGGADAAPFAQLLSTTVVDAAGRALAPESAAGAPLLPFGKRLPVKRVVKLPGAVEGVNDALSGGGEVVSASAGGGGGGFLKKKKTKDAASSSDAAMTLAPTKKAPAAQLLSPEADGWLLRVSYDPASRRGVPRGLGEDLTVGTWKVSGLAKAAASLDAAALAKRARATGGSNARLVSVLGPAKVEVHFRSAADARMEPRRAELVAEFEEEFEVEVAVKEEKKKSKKDKKEEDDKNSTSSDGSNNSTSAASPSPPAPAPAPSKTEKRTRRRTARAPLDLSAAPGLAQPRASEQRLAAARAALALFDAADADAAAAAAAKNELEAFIISLRARLDAANDDSGDSGSSGSSSSGGSRFEEGEGEEEDDAATLRAVSTPDERGALHSSLTEAEDWLYDEGDGEVAAAFEGRLAALEKSAEGMLGRAAERRALPKALARARRAAARAAADAKAWKGGKGKGGADDDAAARPWLPAKDLDALAASAAALEKFVDKEGTAQLKVKDATKPPKLTAAAVEEKAAALEAQRLALASVKKPAPPKKEKEEAKEEAKKEGGDEKKKEEAEKGAPSSDAAPPSSDDEKKEPTLERESGGAGGSDDLSSADDGHDEL